MSLEWETLGLRVRIPSGVPLALLLRHAERHPLPSHAPGNDVSLTEAGHEAARRLGSALGPRLLRLHTSPVPRCVQTAEALRRGAGVDCPMVEDRMLGDPGVFVEQPRQAWTSWLERGLHGIAEALMTGARVPAGFAEPRSAARRLATHLSEHLSEVPGVHVFVSHDILMIPFVAQALGRVLEDEAWPDFLHGALLWRDGGRWVLAYREWTRVLEWTGRRPVRA
jgi:broad specificity phosphatase PhoE